MSLAVAEEHIGQQGKCSRCGTVFTIQKPAVAQPVTAPPRPVFSLPQADVAPGVIRVADGIGRGFDILHANLGNFILMGLTLLGLMLLVHFFSCINPCFGVFISIAGALVIYPALMAGFYRACLKQCDGGQAEVGDLFAEFDQWLDYILLFLVQMLIAFTVWIPGAVVIGLSLIPTAQGNRPIVPLLILGILILVVCVVASGLGLVFVLPALVDRRRGIGDAISTSWRLMLSNPIGLLGAVLLAGLLGTFGGLLCGIGLIYTIPATFCMFSAIYRTEMPPAQLMQSQFIAPSTGGSGPNGTRLRG
jgi:hypothetical protein